MGYCTSCTGCCQLCGDPALESCATCDGTAPDPNAAFWTAAAMIAYGLVVVDSIRRTRAGT